VNERIKHTHTYPLSLSLSLSLYKSPTNLVLYLEYYISDGCCLSNCQISSFGVFSSSSWSSHFEQNWSDF
jgi:hypothetical protein